MPKLVLDTTQEDYEAAGSKFITFSPDDKVGKLYHKPVEMGVPDWDTPGVSIKFPVTIVDDIDAGKEDKIPCGVGSNALWKLKEVYKNITGSDPKFEKGSDGKNHPVIDPDEIAGKKATAVYEIQMGAKGGDPQAGQTKYPKLINILPAGAKTATESLV